MSSHVKNASQCPGRLSEVRVVNTDVNQNKNHHPSPLQHLFLPQLERSEPRFKCFSLALSITKINACRQKNKRKSHTTVKVQLLIFAGQ